MSTGLDNFVAQGQVGPKFAGEGSLLPLRLSKTGAQVVTNAHGKYHEAAARGKLFIASIAVAGVAPGTALSTTPAFAIWNPVGSGILVSIKQIFLGYVSGTLGAGSMVHAMNVSQVTAPTGGTELVAVPALLSGARGAARSFTGSTVSAATTLLRPSMSLGAGLASTAAFPSLVMDEVDGGIVIPQGVVYAYQGVAAAGTSPLVMIGAVYEEIPA